MALTLLFRAFKENGWIENAIINYYSTDNEFVFTAWIKT